MPRQRKHHRNGVFGGGDGIAEGRIHHHNAARRGAGDIHIVNANAGASHHFQARCDFQHFPRDLGGGPHREAIILTDDGAEFSGRQAGFDIGFNAALTKNRDCGGAELVGDQNARHGLHAPTISASTLASAQSNHGSSALMSAVSTVAPPQMRRPGGASR